MVLRGSQIAPPSLKEAEEALQKAKEQYKLAKEESDRAQIDSFKELSKKSLVSESKEELVSLVLKLKQELEVTKKKEYEAELGAEKAKNNLIKTFQQLGCGGAAGAFARTTVAPIDRVKILMQTSHLTGTESSHRSIASSLRHIVATEGVSKLWRGNLTNCVRVVPHTATQFVAYDKFKQLIVGDGGEVTIPKRLLSGALSGMTAASVTHPLDVVRIRLQTQPELKGVGDAIRHVYKEGGMRTFYKGYVPAMLSLSPFIAINFATMDTLKKLYFGSDDSKLSKKQLQSRNPFSILFLGACSGIIAQTCCYPLDTVRRRMQLAGKNYSGLSNAFTTIVKQEGFRGFYKGMSANALKVVPNNAIRFAAFDVLKSFFVSEGRQSERVKVLERRTSTSQK